MKSSAMTRAKIGLAFLLTVALIALTWLLIRFPPPSTPAQVAADGELHELIGVLIAVYSFVIHSIFATPHEVQIAANPTMPVTPANPTESKS